MFEMLHAIPSGLATSFGGLGVVYLIIGTLLGFVFGVLPGLGGVAALALLIPFSWGMEPQHAMLLFSGAMGAVPFGGSISAILLNVPGTPQNVATAFDGYPLAQQGKAGLAIGTSAAASALGAVYGIFILVILIPILRAVILSFGPPEFLMLILFGLVAIPLFTGRNFLTGLIGGALGLSLSFIGFSGTSGVLRFNMGTFYLYDGLQLTPVVMGLFAVSQAIDLVFSGGTVAKAPLMEKHKFSNFLDGVREVYKYRITFARSSMIGTIIGIIPGMGGVISNMFAWIITAQSSPRKQYFGTGEIEGVVASESANNAKDGGALLPTLAFGIPGSGEMAVLMGAFILHGLAPGPQFLRTSLDVAWSIIFGLLFSNIIVAIIGVGLAHRMAKLTAVRGTIIAPVIVCASLLGALAMRNEPVDMFVTLLFGFIGFIMDKADFSKVTMVLGFILGRLAEMSFSQSMMISENDPSIFFTRPISLGLLILLVLMVVFIQVILPRRKRRALKVKPEAVQKPVEKKAKLPRPDYLRTYGFYFASAMIVWFAFVVATSWTYPFRAKLFPIIVGIFSLVLVAVILAGYVSERVADRLSALRGSQLFDISSADGLKQHVITSAKSVVPAWALFKIAIWFFGAAALFYLVGYLIASIVFLFAFLKLYARHGLKLSTSVTFVCAAIAWGIFSLFLDMYPFSNLFLL